MNQELLVYYYSDGFKGGHNKFILYTCLEDQVSRRFKALWNKEED